MPNKNDFKLTLEAIKNATSCVAIASSLGLPIQKSGDRCPSFIHSGSNPNSVVINDDYWYSFSDAQGGDVIDLLALHSYDGDRGQAIKHLSELTGIPLPNSEYSQKWHEYTQNLCNKVKSWHKNLTDEHRNYLHKRNITDETIDKLKIGFKFDENRIILPMWKNGYVCYYCGRTLGEVTKTNPKYKKPYLDEYNDNSLFGLDTLNRDKSLLVVAEGAFDYLSFYQEGYSTIANAGGTYSKKQTQEMLNIAKNFDCVLLTFDNDTSGNGFTLKMAKQLFTRHIPFKICNLPSKYKDISDYYCDGGNLSHLVENASEGIKKMCQLFKNEEDFEDFIINNRRFIKNTDIIAVFDTIINGNIFPNATKEWLKEVKKSALKPLTDDEIADIIIKKHEFKYNPALGVMEFNGKCWKRMTDDAVKNIIAGEWGKNYTNQKLNSVLGIIKAKRISDEIPNEKPLINFSNGTFEIETGILRSYDKSDFITYQLDYPYDPLAKSNDWDKFINSIFDDDNKIKLLQEYSGYVLFPNCSMQKALYLVGDGANGKSVYLDIIQKIFGGDTNVSNVSLSFFHEKFRLIGLMGKLINKSNEISVSNDEAEANFKAIVAGEPIQGCYKGKDFVDFSPRCKLMFGCNELPKSRDISNGIDRRMLILFFPFTFKENPTKPNEKLMDKELGLRLQTSHNLSAIFNWIYEGYKTLRKNGKFTETNDQEEQMELYRETRDPVITFVKEFEWKQLQHYREEEAVYIDVDFIKSPDLYEMWVNWARKNGFHEGNSKAFSMKFSKHIEKYRPDIVLKKHNGKRGIRRCELSPYGKWEVVTKNVRLLKN